MRPPASWWNCEVRHPSAGISLTTTRVFRRNASGEAHGDGFGGEDSSRNGGSMQPGSMGS